MSDLSKSIRSIERDAQGFANDAVSLFRLAKALKNGEKDEAANIAYRMDTSIRDMIPHDVIEFLDMT